MKISKFAATAGLAAMVSACGGSGSGSISSPPSAPTAPAPSPSPTATPTPTAQCTPSDRKSFVADAMNEWYLFPDTLPANIDPSQYSSAEDFLDALTATARAQGKDRHFTYLTSIAEENAYYNSGATAGFGFRLGLTSDNRLFVTESFENAPALTAGIKRGAEIVAIGTSAVTLRNVSDIIANDGTAGLNDALGPDTNGIARVFRISDGTTTSTVEVTKADFDLIPVSPRYGAQIITDGGQKFGYLNLRTFINTADPELRDAFQTFKDANVDKVIVDLRYNGGGLIDTAQLMGDLLGSNRSSSDVFNYMTFRPSKSANNDVHYFTQQAQSIAPTKIAFIGMGGTASASELVINAFVPFLGADDGLIGSNTYGKPVGQIALDDNACDTRLRVIAFALENADHQGNYFGGLAGTVKASCQAFDDIKYPLGDPRESSTRAALDFLEGKSCTPISASASARTGISAQSSQVSRAGLARRELLMPSRPNTRQREVPGSY